MGQGGRIGKTGGEGVLGRWEGSRSPEVIHGYATVISLIQCESKKSPLAVF